jgi:hypothetical protein
MPKVNLSETFHLHRCAVHPALEPKKTIPCDQFRIRVATGESTNEEFVAAVYKQVKWNWTNWIDKPRLAGTSLWNRERKTQLILASGNKETIEHTVKCIDTSRRVGDALLRECGLTPKQNALSLFLLGEFPTK